MHPALIRSMRRVFMSLILVAPLVAADQQIPPPPPEPPEGAGPGYWDYIDCRNGGYWDWVPFPPPPPIPPPPPPPPPEPEPDPEPGVGPSPDPEPGPSSGSCGTRNSGGASGSVSGGKSVVSNLNQGYMHDAIDYSINADPIGGCAPCGAGQSGMPANAMPPLMISRMHRSRPGGYAGSFGANVYARWDRQITLEWTTDAATGTGGPVTVRLFKPASLSIKLAFTEKANGDAAIDGILKDPAGIYRQVELRNAAGDVTADGSQATQVRMVGHDGSVWTFEVINATNASNARQGRLVSLIDRIGQTWLSVAYRFPADATLATLGNDRQRLWQVTQVADGYGRAASMIYDDSVKRGSRYAIARIDLPNGESIRYAYTGNNLSAVTLPGGDVASFAVTYDTALQKTRWTIADPAAKPGHQRKSVWMTGTSWKNPVTGATKSQTSGLTTRIDNGAGELVYFNRPDPSVRTRFYVFDVGLGYQRITSSSTAALGVTELAVAETSTHSDEPWNLPWSVVRTFTYTGTELRNGATNARGDITAFTVNQRNRQVTRTVHPDGTVTSTTFDDRAMPLLHTDRLGRTTTYAYDSLGNCIQATLGSGTDVSTWHWNYDERGQVTRRIDPNGNATDYEYDAIGQVIAVVDAPDHAGAPRARSTFAYDAVGRVASATDAGGRTIQYAYDARNRLTQRIYADGSAESVRYGTGESAGLVVAEIDRNGIETRYAYDAAGRRVQTVKAHGRPEARIETCTWVPGSSTLKQSCVLDGERVDYAYDSRYRLAATIRHARSGDQRIEGRSYDLLGRMIAVTDAYGRTNWNVHDRLARPVRVVRELITGGVPAMDEAFAAERVAARGIWQLAGYGGMVALGSASADGDILTLTATAYGANGTADKGALWSRQLVGDGSVMMRVDEVGTSASAMHGIMLRGGLDGTAPMFSVYVNPQNGSVGVRHRVAAGQGTIYRTLVSGVLPMALPRWLRIERTGTHLRAGASLDGTTWTWAAPVVVDLPSTVEAGSFLNVLSGATWPVVVRGTVPDIGDADWAGQSHAMRDIYVAQRLAALPRISGANPPYVIEDAAYDAAGQIIARTDGRGVRTTYAYDGQGRLRAQTEAADTMPATTAYGYDAVGNRTSVTSPRGIVTAMTYTGRNLLRSVIEDAGAAEAAVVRTLAYTLTRQSASETDALGRTITSTYGVCCDRLASVIDAAGFETRFGYDFVGNRTSITDANGLTTFTAYDGRNRVRSVTNPAGETTLIAYDDNLTDGVGIDAVPAIATILPGLGLGLGADGSAVASTDAAGATSYELHDGLGRPVARIDALGHATRVAYDAIVDGLVETAQTDPVGHTTRSRTDAAGRVRQQIDALGNVGTAHYDAVGNQLSQRDALGVGWDAIYDARSRPLARTTTRQDTGVTVSWAYDADGNRLAETDAAGKTESYAYDRRNRRIASTDRLGGITRFAYDAVGNLVSISDADNEAAGAVLEKTTQYAHDARNLLIAEAFPSGQQGRTLRVYTYDGARRLTGRQAGILADAFSASPAFTGSPVTTTYAYDAANRLTTRGYGDGAADSFAYDAAGRLTSAASARYAAAVGRVYDAAGRLTSESLTLPDGQLASGVLTPATYAVGYTYSDDNALASQTYPTGAVVTRSYTSRHELATVALNGSQVTGRSYDAAGRLATATAGNGLVETRTYLPGDHLVASIAVPGVTGFGYTYDANGRKLVESQTIGGPGQTFAYDDAGRLTAWTAGTATQAWNLSLVGDWNATTRNGVVETRVNTAVHEAIQVGSNLLTYDQQGNLTRDQHQTSLAWDPENRLIRARITPDASVSGLGSIATYRYDAFGRRIAKTVDGVTTLYLPAGAQTVVELERPALPSSQAAIDGAEADGTLVHMAQAPASGGILPGAGITRVNFQPATTVVPAGFVKDAGRAQAVRTNTLTYGWSADVTGQAVVRHGAVPLVEYDTHIRLEAGQQWRVALPNGSYPVVVVAGDPLSTQQTNHLRVNGERLSDPDPSSPPGYAAGDFDGWARQVTVSDGYLTIAGDVDAVDAKLCFVEIGLAGSALPADIASTLADLMTRMTNQTGATPQPVEQVREFVYGAYADEVVVYRQDVDGIIGQFYPHCNHLYSVAALTNAAGQVVERYSYDTYGKQRIVDGTGAIPRGKSGVGWDRGFTGYIKDEETGLLHARARQYSSTLGRFVGRDPMGYINGLALYAAYYVPNGVDPSGYAVIDSFSDAINQYASGTGGVHAAGPTVVSFVKGSKDESKIRKTILDAFQSSGASCGKSGSFSASGSTSAGSLFNPVIGRTTVYFEGNCTYTCTSCECFDPQKIVGFGSCDCVYKCPGMRFSFSDYWDFTPHATDPALKRLADILDGAVADLMSCLISGKCSGVPFSINGSFTEDKSGASTFLCISGF